MLSFLVCMSTLIKNGRNSFSFDFHDCKWFSYEKKTRKDLNASGRGKGLQ